MIKTRADIEKELNEFCSELKPHASYGPDGEIRVRCTWGLDFIVYAQSPIEHAKQELLGHVYEHIGKLTVLARKFEDDLKGGDA